MESLSVLERSSNQRKIVSCLMNMSTNKSNVANWINNGGYQFGLILRILRIPMGEPVILPFLKVLAHGEWEDVTDIRGIKRTTVEEIGSQYVEGDTSGTARVCYRLTRTNGEAEAAFCADKVYLCK